jgi:hypothetical protein
MSVMLRVLHVCHAQVQRSSPGTPMQQSPAWHHARPHPAVRIWGVSPAAAVAGSQECMPRTHPGTHTMSWPKPGLSLPWECMRHPWGTVMQHCGDMEGRVSWPPGVWVWDAAHARGMTVTAACVRLKMRTWKGATTHSPDKRLFQLMHDMCLVMQSWQWVRW